MDHPAHYGGDTVYEAIKVIEAWDLDFHLGNTVKYIARAGKKGDALEDLQKAAWYLQRKIESFTERTVMKLLIPLLAASLLSGAQLTVEDLRKCTRKDNAVVDISKLKITRDDTLGDIKVGQDAWISFIDNERGKLYLFSTIQAYPEKSSWASWHVRRVQGGWLLDCDTSGSIFEFKGPRLPELKVIGMFHSRKIK